MSVRLSPLKLNSFGDLDLFDLAVELGDADFFSGAQRAVEDARDGEAARVVAVIEIGDQNLQRAAASPAAPNSLDDGLKQRLKVGSRNGEIGGRGAEFSVGIEHGELKAATLRRPDR